VSHATRSIVLVAALALAAGCASQQVEFAQGHCLVDGHPATLAEVEAHQAALTERILRRQPLFVVVTLLIVVLAGASHVEKLVLLFSARHVPARGLGDRVRAALDRYRAHPLRYFAIVGSTLLLLAAAGGVYVYLDADKRASERALGLLQFCHLALREGEAQSVLDEQRRNLDALEATTGNIRALIDKLPPDEQRKAEQIVERINTTIGRQGKLMSEYLARGDENMKGLAARTAALEHGLDGVGAAVTALRSVPSDLKAVAETTRGLDARLMAIDTRAQQVDGKLAAAQAALKDLAARPACPPCVCAPANAPANPAKGTQTSSP
jgi:hypothetical protein